MKYIVCVFNGFWRGFASMKVLNVAEKNEAAKNIAAILSRGGANRREGFSKFNKIYEFPMEFDGLNCTFVMTSLSGHLLENKFNPCFRSWTSCDPSALFEAPIQKQCNPNFLDIKRTLEKEVRNCSKLIIWTDCDREGENIGMEVVEVCKQIKPSIQVGRAKFSEITPAAIHRAVNNLVAMHEPTCNAVDARSELDLRIGAAFTRFQTLRLKRVFPLALGNQLVSYGSCQFPTLGFVVERFREVENFVPESFWKISVDIKRQESVASFTWKRGRLFDRDCCAAYHEHLLEHPIGQVIDVQQRPKSKWRPLPMDTVEMEKLSSRKLRIGAKQTMQIAELLYTKGFISYPRTETNIFPKDLNLQPLVEAQTQDHRWSGFAQNLLTNGLRPRAGKKSDQAHPPIHPLKAGNTLQGDDARLYELITRHFLACLSEDAKGAETSVVICLGVDQMPTNGRRLTNEDGELFESKGLVIHARNYLEVYVYERWSERDMPNFQLGEVIDSADIQMLEGQTTSPPLLTEADLIGLMDKHGIGTDATHAEHIETIKTRLYVGLMDNNFLVPGQLGMGLVEGYDAMQLTISKPNLRAELEKDLKAICEGRKSKEEVLRSQLSKYKSVFETAVLQARKLDQAIGKHIAQEAEHIPDDGIEDRNSNQYLFGGYPKMFACPDCGQDVILKQKNPQPATEVPLTTRTSNRSANRTWFLSCTGYPACRYAIWLPDAVLSARPVQIDAIGSDCIPSSCLPCGSSCPSRKHHSSAALMALKFRIGTLLPGGYVQDKPETEYVTCVYCDEELRMAYGIRLPHTAAPSSSVAVTTSSISRHPQQPLSRQPISSPQQPGRHASSGSSTASSSTTSSISRHPQQPLSRQPISSPQQPGSSTASSSVTTSGNQPFRSASTTSSVLPPNSGLHFQPSRMAAPSASSSRSNAVGCGGSDIVCNCGVLARTFTVRKEGANQGRGFYKCGEAQNGCDFFLWKEALDDDYSSTFSRVGESLSHQSSSKRTSNDIGGPLVLAGSAGDSVCGCGLPCPLRTVQKASVNKGRQFYGCPNSVAGDANAGCRFFQWADEPPVSGRRGGGGRGSSSRRSDGMEAVASWPQPAPRGSGAGSSTFVGMGSRGRGGGRKCSLCHLPGHTKNRCPTVSV